ncbi:GNAT family N-acetyltransferase [Dactylosporangium sp. NPDC000244]|uniref:GNAT family N-acetyltransferase n=1 Tax=Dactylosporangium sp. NPDC000244 TaxID=3154365 RepID=UPI003324B897
MRVRPAARADAAAIYRLCAAVDATGAAAPPRYHRPELPGHLYAGPYLAASPGLTFVADVDGVAGYVAAVADTARFADWAERCWWPRLRRRYPLTPDPHDGTRDHALVAAIHAGSGPRRPWHDSHPAHLHIKVAARAQGRGCGRRLMGTVLGALHRRGVPGVHLGVAEANRKAVTFYFALGFTEAHRHPWGRTLVLDLPEWRQTCATW